ncbi:hypothetical protein OG705_07575 [Streptomyces sp. NBC_00838]|nr:hypothetical protein OG705_07575 [Streptomyces sp. NBC_00838]
MTIAVQDSFLVIIVVDGMPGSAAPKCRTRLRNPGGAAWWPP